MNHHAPLPLGAAAIAAALETPSQALRRGLVIALLAFLTLVDLFATQAILPSLVLRYGATPAAMGIAVNASTLGMAVASLGVALLSRRIDRRRGVWLSLALLSVPTALLAGAPNLATFTALRIVQGLFMAAAFTLTLAHLAERCDARAAVAAFAAYITGNVASNLIGRLLSAALADEVGLAGNFYGFALLNLCGAVLAWRTLGAGPGGAHRAPRSQRLAWLQHLRHRPLAAAFGIGFCILFAFIGTFTFINFLLVAPPFGLSPMVLGTVYLVFLPSILTTPLAGRAVARLGSRRTLWLGLATAAAGLPALLLEHLGAVLAGLALVGVGTFFAQATATGFVGRAAMGDRGAASGLYLASYFLGGLAGSATLGPVFDAFGWSATVGGIGAALGTAALLGLRLPKD